MRRPARSRSRLGGSTGGRRGSGSGELVPDPVLDPGHPGHLRQWDRLRSAISDAVVERIQQSPETGEVVELGGSEATGVGDGLPGCAGHLGERRQQPAEIGW